MYASPGPFKGFAYYRDLNGIKGVIFTTPPHAVRGASLIAESLASCRRAFCQGRKAPRAAPQAGHCGGGQIAELEAKLALLGELAERHIDMDALLLLAASAPAIDAPPRTLSPLGSTRIAVARDEAFCFLYEENLELLSMLGCEPVFFSPLRDERLPEGASGLYLCGGYPELHLEALSRNAPMLRAVAAAIGGGMPTIAECGGFLYLHERLDGVPMAGVIPAEAYRTEKLVRFGYITLRAEQDNLLCAAGESIRSHEFHYYESAEPGGCFTAEKPSPGGAGPAFTPQKAFMRASRTFILRRTRILPTITQKR
jgi:cobyrinic acid a,c-diamide synthase